MMKTKTLYYYLPSLRVVLPMLLCIVLFTSCNSARRGTVQQAVGEKVYAPTGEGEIIGEVTPSGVYVFKGVPYAKAERFMAPEPAPKRHAALDCTTYGAVPPQVIYERTDSEVNWYQVDEGTKDEDCLNLNIWTRDMRPDTKKPVLVYLFTGYTIGHSHELSCYDGEYMANSHNLVVVTPNHRLNSFGFLDLSFIGQKYQHSANAGILDLVAALRWIKANIANFGGNPDNIILMGQGTGGGKVLTLMSMPQTEGLIHKVIIESGSLFKVMDSKYSRRLASITLEELGITGENISTLDTISHATLREAAAKALERVRELAFEDGTSNAFVEDDNLIDYFGWAPSLDGVAITEQPYVAAPRRGLNIPILIGTNKHEATPSLYKSEFSSLDERGRDSMAITRLGSFYSKAEELYRLSYPRTSYFPSELYDLDINFRRMALNLAERRYEMGGTAPIYMYLFGFESPVEDGIFRSHHMLEIPFVMGNTARAASMTGGTQNALALSEKMSSAWAAFCHTGSPQSPAMPQWPAWTPEGGATMLLGRGYDGDCELVYNHDKGLIELLGRADNALGN
ncbi:MAG: carboxylesterase/lipase family protein [Tidjanibacter sp.]|nr:carboxylesterase/lipase family protein [Tidjanibacter sp.]